MIDGFAKKISPGRRFSRREMLGLMGSATAALLGSGCGRSDLRAADAVVPACVLRPEQTEGPYFVDEQLNRSDIRSEPSDNSIQQGTPLRLQFQVSRIDAASCNRLGGAVVDVWHCDALGIYSDVRQDSRSDARGRKFLRGYQITNASGIAEFLTIYPGWYEGRAVHIHFKIRTEPAGRRRYDFTSQLYFDESITDQVHMSAPYNSRGRRTTMNEGDFIFRSGGKQLMPRLAKSAQGYRAIFEIGLRIA
ncbi:MAG: intradiol ring-cleavage dioxygenase [Candidatus Binatia bacterium]